MPTNQEILWEEAWKRTPNSKRYLLTDGSKQIVIFGNDIHFEDENGNLQDINTKLHDEADLDSWEFPVSNEAKVEFHLIKEKIRTEKLADKLKRDAYGYQVLAVPFYLKIGRNFRRGYTVGKAQNKLTFKPVNASPSVGYTDESMDNIIEYQDAWNDTDVKLEVTDKGIKEFIILKTNKAPASFTYEIGGSLSEDLISGELRILPAWLEDANGTKRDVQQVLRVEGENKYLDIIADITDLAYPAIIDPTVIIQPAVNAGKDTYTSENYPTNNYGNLDHLSLNNNAVSTYAFLEFDLSAIPSDVSVTSAIVALHKHQTTSPTSGIDVRAYRNTETWNEDTLTWNTMPAYDVASEIIFTQDYTQLYNYYDIADFVSDWVNGIETNYGFHLRQITEGSTSISYDSNNYNSSGRPKITVIYDALPTAPVVTVPNGSETWNATETVTWTASTDADTAQANLRYNIQLSINNGATYPYTIVALTSAGAVSYEYDFSAIPQSSTCLLRIRAYDGVGYGPWDVSNGVFTIQHNQAPTAPTNLAPSGTIVDRTDVVRLSWQHNDPDNDPQSKFDLLWSSNGGSSWTTVTQVTTNQYKDFSANAFPAGTIVWKIRTYDQADVASAYSNQATFTAAVPSTAPTITAPLATTAVSRPNVTWSSSGQVSYQIQVVDSLVATVYDTNEVVSTNKAQTLGYDLANGGVYSLKVRIKDSGGIWSDWDTESITVSYTEPPLPTISVTAQAGYINVAITNPVPAGLEPTITGNDVYRRESGDTTWERIATGIADDGNYRDYAVASGTTYEYKARALGSNGTYKDSALANQTLTLRGIWLHDVADPDGTVHQFRTHDSRSPSWKPEYALMQFAGRTRGVVEFGEIDEVQISVGLKISKSTDDMSALDALARSKPTVCYRDSRGRKVFGIIPGLAPDDEWYGNTVGLTVIETDYTEVI